MTVVRRLLVTWTGVVFLFFYLPIAILVVFPFNESRLNMDFFIEESGGHCTPCRVGLVLLKKAVHNVENGSGEPADLQYMRRFPG